MFQEGYRGKYENSGNRDFGFRSPGGNGVPCFWGAGQPLLEGVYLLRRGFFNHCRGFSTKILGEEKKRHPGSSGQEIPTPKVIK